MLKLLIYCQELMKRDIQNGKKHVNVSADQMQKFVTINSTGMKINVDADLKN